MKTLLKLSAFTILIVLVVLSCKKTLSSKEASIPDPTGRFDAAFVKEWYYGVFKKSAEWKSSSQHGKKLPDWKNGTYQKIGNMEIVEFPLFKARSTVSVQSGNSLTSSEIKRLAEATLARIAFIKGANGKITVRELDYIPDLKYLKTMNYDISGVSSGKLENKFSGRIITKRWNGQLLSYSKITEGKFTGKGVIKPTPSKGENTSNTEGCVMFEICEYERECSWTIIGDSWEVTCTEWVPTGYCWTEEYCNEDPCEYMTEEECACQVYGYCGGGEETNCDPTLISPQEEEFNNYVLSEFSPEELETPVSSGGSSPIYGSRTWDVVKGQIAGWKVQANTVWQYYHYTFYNTNTNSLEHTYDLFYFQTGSGYFVGSNTFITSTYTTTNPTTNNVFNNNTSDTYGKSEVFGSIRHVANYNWPIPLPFCPKTLDITQNVNNSIVVTPK